MHISKGVLLVQAHRSPHIEYKQGVLLVQVRTQRIDIARTWMAMSVLK